MVLFYLKDRLFHIDSFNDFSQTRKILKMVLHKVGNHPLVNKITFIFFSLDFYNL